MLSCGESPTPSSAQAQAGQTGPFGVPERRLALTSGFWRSVWCGEMLGGLLSRSSAAETGQFDGRCVNGGLPMA